MSRWQKAKSKVENTTMMLRLFVVGGSAWLLWKKWQKEQLAEEADLLESQARAAGGSPSAMAPLVPQTTQALPNAGQEQTVAYQGTTPEQAETAAALPKPAPVDLTPGQQATALLAQSAGWLTSALETS